MVQQVQLAISQEIVRHEEPAVVDLAPLDVDLPLPAEPWSLPVLQLPPGAIRWYGDSLVRIILSWFWQTVFTSSEPMVWVSHFQLYVDFMCSTGHPGPVHKGKWLDGTLVPNLGLCGYSFKQRTRWFVKVLKESLRHAGIVLHSAFGRPSSQMVLMHTGVVAVLYMQMCLGKREEVLEVFDREKKIGFSMSCMVAKVSWEHSSNSYVANYVSASHVQPERIPADQKHRLRFCPAGTARDQLQPEIGPPGAAEIYPYRVLKGYDGVVLGQGVELQWKMQIGSPFGWWYGKVERLERNGATAAVTLIFPHFPTNSRWYRLRVVVGDGVVRRCAIGGYHGGLRAVTAEEEKVWSQFIPKQPIMF
eukprot:s234_g36.t1